MSDEKDRLGDKLHQVDAAREDQWAHQRDEEILEKLRRKYVKAIACPQCGQNLEARVAIGVGETPNQRRERKIGRHDDDGVGDGRKDEEARRGQIGH